MIYLLFLFIIIYLCYYNKDNFKSNNTYRNKSNNKLSVIILSYNRPHNIEQTIKKIHDYDIIDEILILHGSLQFYKKYNYKKVKYIIDFKNNELYGAARRFLNVKFAKNDIILFLDDDILPSKKLIYEGYTKVKNSNSNTFYGKYKRTCTKNEYSSSQNAKNNVILIGLSFCKKNILEKYITHKNGFSKYKHFLKKHKGNCEDLAFNLFIIKHYKTQPQYLNERYIELDKTNGYESDKNHYKIRDLFCKTYF